MTRCDVVRCMSWDMMLSLYSRRPAVGAAASLAVVIYPILLPSLIILTKPAVMSCRCCLMQRRDCDETRCCLHL